MRSKLIVAFAVAVALGAAGSAMAALTGVSSTAPSAAQGPAKVTVESSRFGKVLFDGRGYSLYLFAADKGKSSACYGGCAKAWPPFLTKGKPSAGPGVDARLLGTTRRRDRSLQVTYAGHPLYYYEGDGKGDVKCQNVSNFGSGSSCEQTERPFADGACTTGFRSPRSGRVRLHDRGTFRRKPAGARGGRWPARRSGVCRA